MDKKIEWRRYGSSVYDVRSDDEKKVVGSWEWIERWAIAKIIRMLSGERENIGKGVENGNRKR